MQINNAGFESMNVFRIFALQYAAAPPPVHSRAPIVIRGYSGGQREELHSWVGRHLKNMETKSVADPLAPGFVGRQPLSITLGRKRDSDAIGDDSEELDWHRQLHPANFSGKPMHYTTNGWSDEPAE